MQASVPLPDEPASLTSGVVPRLVYGRDALEIELGALWSEVLGISIPEPTDDFFVLGGSSFDAVAVVARLRERYDVDLTVADLMEAATIERLAALLKTGERPPRVGTLVTIKVGTDPVPLFLFHALPGTVVRFVTLADALPDSLTIYGLQARGLDPGETPHATIEAMAADYYAAIRTVYPEGPLALAGYSLGGVIAHELAGQVLASGEEVAFVGLLDTPPVWAFDDALDYATPILVRFGLRLNTPLEPLLAMNVDARLDRLLELAADAGSLPALHDRERLRCMLEMYRANAAALQRYELRPVPVDALLIESDDTIEEHATVWRGFVKSLGRARVTGDHFLMLEAEHIAPLARALAERLALAQRAAC